MSKRWSMANISIVSYVLNIGGISSNTVHPNVCPFGS